jgi:hypothetical protein
VGVDIRERECMCQVGMYILAKAWRGWNATKYIEHGDSLYIIYHDMELKSIDSEQWYMYVHGNECTIVKVGWWSRL